MTVHERTYNFAEQSGTSFYRQPGGCLEIRQEGIVNGEDDLVHICTAEISAFLEKLKEFVEKTQPMH